ncbi:MAG: hypothetical protein CR986_09365 [Ignavibacteriae bacterium]|nr:MAG: hypothetical protein CR986_09365 [Ignavibacteriota bacterium]
MNKNIYKAAKIFSYIFIPPVMNLFIFIIFSNHYESNLKNLIGITISFLFGLLIPMITILIFRKKGLLSDNDATIKEERTTPYVYAIIYSTIGIVLTLFFELNDYITMLWLVYLLNSIIILIINYFWKVSAHTMGVGMPLGAIFFLNNHFLLLITAIILVIVVLARLILKVHTILQLIVGAIIGFLNSYLILKYLL